jgi:hypothetical protein
LALTDLIGAFSPFIRSTRNLRSELFLWLACFPAISSISA